MDIKEELKRVPPYRFTGYDRNGKAVKNVTSDNKGDVENPSSNDRWGFIEHEFRI